MKQEKRKEEALEYLNSVKKYHVDESYGDDCQIYKHYGYVVDIKDAEHAIDIAIGNF
jgi:hypothetical protein